MTANALLLATTKGYYISNSGSVFGPSGSVVRTFRSGGYAVFNLKSKGKVVRVQAHRLQAYQKYGRTINGRVVSFVDGDKTNIAADNLFISFKTIPNLVKLDVRHRYRYWAHSVMEIARHFKMNHGTVHRIIHGR